MKKAYIKLFCVVTVMVAVVVIAAVRQSSTGRCMGAPHERVEATGEFGVGIDGLLSMLEATKQWDIEHGYDIVNITLHFFFTKFVKQPFPSLNHSTSFF